MMRTNNDFNIIFNPNDKSELFSYYSNYSLEVKDKDIIIIDPSHLLDYSKIEKEKNKYRQDIHKLEFYEGYLDDLGFNNYLIGSSYNDSENCDYITIINSDTGDIFDDVKNDGNNMGVFLVEEIEKCPYIKNDYENLSVRINEFTGVIKMYLDKSLYNDNDTFIIGDGYIKDKPLKFKSIEANKINNDLVNIITSAYHVFEDIKRRYECSKFTDGHLENPIAGIDLLTMIAIPDDRLEEQLKWIDSLGVQIINFIKETSLTDFLLEIPKEYFNNTNLNKLLSDIDNIECSTPSDQFKKEILRELYKIIYKLVGYVE